jgi:hypothetical protein
MSTPPSARPAGGRWALVLLVLPFIGLLVPNWYARSEPRISGIPFFIWYQFAWVFGGVAVTAFVYFMRRGGEDEQ